MLHKVLAKMSRKTQIIAGSQKFGGKNINGGKILGNGKF